MKEEKSGFGIFGYAYAIFILAIIGVGSTILYGLGQPTNNEFGQPLEYHTNVCVYKNGELIDCNHNTITNVGKDFIKTSLTNTTGVTNNTINILALGNSSPTVAATTTLNSQYNTCGLANGTGTYNSNSASNGNWSMTRTWTSSCDGSLVNTTGLYRAPGVPGELFAGASFTSTTLQNNDQLTINYTIWVS